MARSSGQRKLSGIYRYLATHESWQTQLIESSDELSASSIQDALDAGFDGFILSLTGSRDTYRRIVRSSSPLVVMDIYSPVFDERKYNISFVHSSAKAIATAAFEHFYNQGRFVSYVFVPASENRQWSTDRGDHFMRLAAQHGINCHFYSDSIDLPHYLRSLPHPVCVFAATDIRASEVLQAARIARMSVPQRIAVIGVDDNEAICNNTVPKLSSIRPAFEEEGYRAAEELDRMMNRANHKAKDPATRKIAYIENATVSARESTAEQTTAGKLVERAIRYIRENAPSGISVSDVVRKMRVSQRLLYLRFAEHRGQTIQQVIDHYRIEEVKRLLKTTGLSISEICTRCGYSCENVLRNQFKRLEGISMSAFRAQTTKRP